MEPLIRLEGIDKTYRAGEVEVPVLRSVSFDIAAGEFVAIMGASGSGKSTLMNIVGCLDKPSSGRYLLSNVDVTTLHSGALARLRNRHIGFIFQQFNLLSRTTAVGNVELPLVYAGVARQERRQRAIQALARVGLESRLMHHPSQLSGGQQQRVAIARALVAGPTLLLADEPTGSLDSTTSRAVMELLTELWREGLTIVLVTHEAEMAMYAERIVVLADGVISSDRRRSLVGPTLLREYGVPS
ncbi:MAG: ABC transporter ATP-binding protein [Myxococcales bacterium]